MYSDPELHFDWEDWYFLLMDFMQAKAKKSSSEVWKMMIKIRPLPRLVRNGEQLNTKAPFETKRFPHFGDCMWRVHQKPEFSRSFGSYKYFKIRFVAWQGV